MKKLLCVLALLVFTNSASAYYLCEMTKNRFGLPASTGKCVDVGNVFPSEDDQKRQGEILSIEKSNADGAIYVKRYGQGTTEYHQDQSGNLYPVRKW